MKYFGRSLSNVNLHKRDISLKGKKYISPSDLSIEEIKSLLMSAIELKTSKNSYTELDLLVGRNITFLFNKPCLNMQTCLYSTSKLLKMSLNNLLHPNWEMAHNPQDIGRLLSSSADIIFCRAQRQSRMEQFAKGSTVPVINISSCKFILLQILSDLLTLQQHFGNLKGLVVAWVGASCPLLNTYLSVAPLLEMKIKFLCRCGGPVSPSNLENVQSQGTQFIEKIQECGKLEEAIEGANVIATSQHSEINLKLKLEDLEKYADKNWVFLHALPRSSIEAENEVFDSDRNLLWKSFINSKWICAAIISRFLDLGQKITESNGL